MRAMSCSVQKRWVLRFCAAHACCATVAGDVGQPFLHIASVLSSRECEELMQATDPEKMLPSLSVSRALEALQMGTAFRQPISELDADGDGVIDCGEAAAAIRFALRAPLFTSADACAWLGNSTGEPRVSVQEWSSLLANETVVASTLRFFEDLFLARPQLFSRFSRQVPAQWSELVHHGWKPSFATRLASLTGMPEAAISAGEPLQIIQYGIGGHYAPHSDSGWPGHRPISVLIYLRVPDQGGETCFVPESAALLPPFDDPAQYATDCASVLTKAGGSCVMPSVGDALLWNNTWRLDGSLEVPSAHAACPVVRGGKWVASGWIAEFCDSATHICS